VLSVHRILAVGINHLATSATVVLVLAALAASLEGWPQARLLPSFETPRKRAALQDDGGRHCKRSNPEAAN